MMITPGERFEIARGLLGEMEELASGATGISDFSCLSSIVRAEAKAESVFVAVARATPPGAPHPVRGMAMPKRHSVLIDKYVCLL